MTIVILIVIGIIIAINLAFIAYGIFRGWGEIDDECTCDDDLRRV
jgi:hypothetical protein